MQKWMPGATRLGSYGGGTLVGGPPRVTWHITFDKLKPERPTFLGVMHYLTGIGFEPTIGWDPLTGKIVQFLPGDRSARALKNLDGGVETNRLGSVHVQIEAFFTPGMTVNGKTYAELTDTPMIGLAEILAWTDSLGVPRVWTTPRDNRSISDWKTKAGHRAHYNVPENDHRDIVGADVKKLLMLNRPVTTTPATTIGDFKMDKATADAIRAIIQDELKVVSGQRTPDHADTDREHISLADLYTQGERVEARLAALEAK